PVLHGHPVGEPYHLGPGWVGFNFKEAFKRPVKIVNDAAMQALASYKGGRMLFLGLGTGLGSAMIVEGDLEPMELAHLPYKKGRTYEDYVGVRGLKRLGKRRWRKHAFEVIGLLRAALEPDYVVLGGGNAGRGRAETVLGVIVRLHFVDVFLARRRQLGGVLGQAESDAPDAGGNVAAQLLNVRRAIRRGLQRGAHLRANLTRDRLAPR